MPTHRALVEEFQISSATLQHAFDRLAEFGFVDSRGSIGTFVVADPQRRACTALVFADEPNQGSWNRFLGTMLRSSEASAGAGSAVRMRPYFVTRARAGSAAALALLADAKAGVLTGIAFVYPPYYLQAQLFDLPVPRVIVAGGDGEIDRVAYQASVLRLVSDDLRGRLLEDFARSGRRRLAVLMSPGQEAGVLCAHAASIGLETRPEWFLGLPVDPISAVAARTVIHLLCSKPVGDRPDCLIICDDNHVPHATAGIVDAGLMPTDLAVAAHANFPDVTRSLVPCRRFGFDAETVTAATHAELTRLQAGGATRVIDIAAEVRSTAQ